MTTTPPPARLSAEEQAWREAFAIASDANHNLIREIDRMRVEHAHRVAKLRAALEKGRTHGLTWRECSEALAEDEK